MIELAALFGAFMLVGLYIESRRQTDALARIAKAIEERGKEP
jgi:hypothetical protein